MLILRQYVEIRLGISRNHCFNFFQLQFFSDVSIFNCFEALWLSFSYIITENLIYLYIYTLKVQLQLLKSLYMCVCLYINQYYKSFA